MGREESVNETAVRVDVCLVEDGDDGKYVDERCFNIIN